MAFGINRQELMSWKNKVSRGELAFITHYWYDPRFPDHHTVTKVGCNDLGKLLDWGEQYGLKPEWIDHHADYPHFDLLGDTQMRILAAENLIHHLTRFHIR